MTVLPPRALDAGLTGWRGVSGRLIWVEVASVVGLRDRGGRDRHPDPPRRPRCRGSVG